MSQAECPFCNILKKETDKIIWEDDNVICFVPLDMKVYGHLLVVPKKHINSVLEISQDEFILYSASLHFIANTLVTILNADGINILNANGVAAQQSVAHLHFHLMPRFKDDNLDLWPEITEGEVSSENLTSLLQSGFSERWVFMPYKTKSTIISTTNTGSTMHVTFSYPAENPVNGVEDITDCLRAIDVFSSLNYEQ